MRRAIRRAQRHDLIGRNVAELVDLPDGRPGRPSRAMTPEQAGKVLATAAATEAGYAHLVKVGNYSDAATHVASSAGRLACGTRPHKNAVIQHLGDDLAAATCRSCWAQLSLDSTGSAIGTARSAVRRGHHRRPAPRRAKSPHLGSR